MRKQVLAVMVGLSVVLSGCSTQSTESMLQEVKKDTKEIKSGKASIALILKNEDSSSGDGYEMSGDEKFDPLEFKMSGKFLGVGNGLEVERYRKDGVDYTKTIVSVNPIWTKEKRSTDNKHALSFKTESLNTEDSILELLDNKDNWDVTKDGDKVTFKLKKNAELADKVKKSQIKIAKIKEEVKFSEFDYTIEYVFNTKTYDVEKLAYELHTKTEDSTSKSSDKSSLEEINKEVKIELPEESKKAIERNE